MALIIIVSDFGLAMWAPTSSYISFYDFLVAFGYQSILISIGRFEIKAIQLVMVLFTNCECSFNRYLAPKYFVYVIVLMTRKMCIHLFEKITGMKSINTINPKSQESLIMSVCFGFHS